MRRYVVLILSLLLMVLLAACGNDEAKEDKVTEEETEAINVEVSDDEKVADDKVVAQINDVEVTGELYNLIYVLTKIQLGQIGHDFEDLDSLKEVALDILIRQELVIQDANELGVTVSDEEIESELKDLKEESGDQFNEIFDKYNLTENAYKEYLTFALIHDKYLDRAEMEVSDREAKDKFNELKLESDEIPEFDSIKDQIKDSIKQEKLQEKVDELKEKANIEMFI